jgi:hypothetical protein
MKKIMALLLVLLTMSLLTGCDHGAGDGNGETSSRVPGVAMSTMSFGPEQNVTPENLKGKIEVMNVAPYTGIYMEAGPFNKSREENVYALKVTNTSTETILNAVLVYNDGTQDLNFFIEMLPAGKSVYVVELTKKQVVSTKLTFVQGAVNYLEEGVENKDAVAITPNRNFSVTVKNLSDKEIPCVWIFYRKVLEDGTLLGGRTLSTLCETILPGEELDVQAEFWQYNSCELVNVLLLDKVPDFSEEDTSSK